MIDRSYLPYQSAREYQDSGMQKWKTSWTFNYWKRLPMSRKKLYENKLKMDYSSDNYIRFEEDFQKYSAMDIPLTFLVDDILRTMAMNQKNYFKLNKENSKDGRDHYFCFEVSENQLIRKFNYINVQRK